ncbi:hypothetical protein EDB19DRAFT_502978 [Suillus lakei]|nr:hypothetical protein EDB19DRAFT_502978 [Suillus lakei]
MGNYMRFRMLTLWMSCSSDLATVLLVEFPCNTCKGNDLLRPMNLCVTRHLLPPWSHPRRNSPGALATCSKARPRAGSVGSEIAFSILRCWIRALHSFAAGCCHGFLSDPRRVLGNLSLCLAG